MEIIGDMARLSRRERRLFQCEPETPVNALDCKGVLEDVAAERERAENMPCLTAFSAAVYVAGIINARSRERLAAGVAEQVLVYETETQFGIPHEPAIRPDNL